MKRILILITKSNWGGAQRYVFDVATSLPKDAYDVEVMAGGGGVLIEKLTEAGIKADGNLPIGRDVRISEDLKAFFKLMKILREKKPDILHVNSSKIGGLGALAGRLSRVPRIIFTAHGWAFNENRSVFSKVLIKASYWLTLFLSHKTIAVSEAAKSQIENWPLVYDKICVINNGIKAEPIFSRINARNELSRIFPELKKALAVSHPQKLSVIGTIAELHHIKGYEYALQAIRGLVDSISASHPNLKVLYVMIGEGGDRPRLERMIADLKLENNVLMLGHVPNASHYLRAFDIFLLSSLSEGLAYVLLETGLASLPVVATAVGGIPEVVDDMKSGVLIQSRKPKEIQHALEFFMAHPKLQKEYSAVLHEKILKNFSIEHMMEKTISAYTN